MEIISEWIPRKEAAVRIEGEMVKRLFVFD